MGYYVDGNYHFSSSLDAWEDEPEIIEPSYAGLSEEDIEPDED